MNTKRKTGKQHQSRLLLTINSLSTDGKYKKLLKDGFTEMYDKIEDYVKYMVKTGSVKDIMDVDCETAIEVGTKLHRVHLHSIITISHKTMLQLDLKKITKHFEEKLGLALVYVNARYVKDPLFSLRNYLKKTIEENW